MQPLSQQVKSGLQATSGLQSSNVSFCYPTLSGKSHHTERNPADVQLNSQRVAICPRFMSVLYLERRICSRFCTFQDIWIYSHILLLTPQVTLGESYTPSVLHFPVCKRRTRSSQFFCLIFGLGDFCSRNCLLLCAVCAWISEVWIYAGVHRQVSKHGYSL